MVTHRVLCLPLQAEFRKLQDKQAAAEAAAAAAAEPATTHSNSTPRGSSRAAGSRGGRGKQQQEQQREQQQVDPKRLAKADKAKQRGNEAFKEGKYRCGAGACV
jgi:hypothetical protein